MLFYWSFSHLYCYIFLEHVSCACLSLVVCEYVSWALHSQDLGSTGRECRSVFSPPAGQAKMADTAWLSFPLLSFVPCGWVEFPPMQPTLWFFAHSPRHCDNEHLRRDICSSSAPWCLGYLCWLMFKNKRFLLILPGLVVSYDRLCVSGWYKHECFLRHCQPVFPH